jgi:hypothetical protein
MKPKKYKTGSVTITVDYGYDIHSVTFSRQNYDRIAAGKKVAIKGQGFYLDGLRVQDFWVFNRDEPGSLYVGYEDAGEIYIGNIDDGEVSIDPERKSN